MHNLTFIYSEYVYVVFMKIDKDRHIFSKAEIVSIDYKKYIPYTND